MSEIEKLNMIAEWQEQHKQLIEDLDNSKKRIVELEERVWRQKKKIVEKTKNIAELEAKIKHLTKHLEPQAMSALFEQVEEEVKQEQRIEELEAQIEKMKCCYNCKHSRTEYEHCRTDKHEKWEIKENE